MLNINEFNELFLGKKDNRKNQLFILLYLNNTDGIYLKKLSINLDISSKTLYNDLKELKDDIIEVYNMPLLCNDGKGKVSLDFSKPFFVKKLKIHYIKKARDFWIFHEILQKPIRFHQMKKNLRYYSKSAIYQSIFNLNKKFKTLNISFSMSDVKGDEKKIRLLLFKIYWSHFGGFTWPFESERQHLLKEVEKFEKHVIKLNEVEAEQLLYWLAITEMRLKNRKFIEKSNAVKSQKNIQNKEIQKIFDDNLCNYIPTQFIEHESNFYINTIFEFMGYTNELKEKKQKNKNINPLEHFENLVKLKIDSCSQNFSIDKLLKKLRYYVEENLTDVYNFFEPNAKKYFEENEKYLDFDINKSLNELPRKIRSMYLYELKKNGISLLQIVRIKIISNEEHIQPKPGSAGRPLRARGPR